MVLKLCFSLVVLGYAGSALAGSYVGTGTGDFKVEISGDLGGERFPSWDDPSATPNYTRTIQVTPDWSVPAIRIDSMEFVSQPFSFTLSRSFTVGPGQTREIVAKFDIDATSSSVREVGPIPMTPGLNGAYALVSRFNWGSKRLAPLILTGRYEIAGPSETLQGDFSVELAAGGGNCRGSENLLGGRFQLRCRQ